MLQTLTKFSIPDDKDLDDDVFTEIVKEQLESLIVEQKTTKSGDTIAGLAPLNLLRMMNEGLVAVDLSDKILYVNESFCTMHGYSADELIGQEAGKLLTANSEYDNLIKTKLQGRAKGVADTYELENVRKDGKVINVWVSGKPLYDDDGVVIGSVGVVTDITKLKHVEAQQMASELQFRKLFESSPDAIFVEDFNGIVLDVNPAACALHDLTHDAFVGTNIFDLFDENRRDPMREQFNKFTTGELTHLESITPLSTGGFVPVGINVSVIEYKGVPAILLMVRDISNRKKMEDALRRSEKKYRALFEGSHGLMCTHDLDGNMLSVNPAAGEIVGLPVQQLLELNISDILLNSDPAVFENYIAEITENKIASGIMKAKDREGKDLYVAFRNVLYEEEGSAPYVIGSGVDITDRYIIEKELEQANSLAEINIERLHEALKELERANREVESSAQVKEEFLANMSHEIRTPLNAIIGFTDLLAETKLSQEQMEHLDAVHTSGKKLLKTINEILDFSKLEAGKLDIESTVFNVQQVIKEEHRLFAPKAAEKGISYEYKMDVNDVPTQVVGDPYRLRQILSNLIGNAIKFTEEGGVTLSARVVEDAAEAVVLEFAVKDSGIGIPKEKHDQVFENFVQAKSSTTRKYGGTGLGLAIVKRLVDLQQGKIDLKSATDAGAEFAVTITYLKYKGEHESASNSTISGGERLQDLLVLLAEDNDLNRQLTTRALESNGHTVHVALNGREAVNMVQERQYDIVLMDIQMPELDGEEASRIIRQELQMQVPIIALTAHTFSKEIERYLALGVNAHLAKPFRKQELLRLIQHVLHKDTAMLEEQANDQLVDLSFIKELADNDPEFICEMLELFIEQNPSDVALLEKHISIGDLENVRTAAHKVRNSYNSIGCAPGGQILAKMEELAQQSVDPAHLSALMDELLALSDPIFEVLRAELEHYAEA